MPLKLSIALVLTLGVLASTGYSASNVSPAVRAGAAPGPDIFQPDWLVSCLPSPILVVKTDAKPPIPQLFQEALTRIRSAKSIQLDELPANQTKPKLLQKAPLDHKIQKTADAGFWVLISQTGKVVAIFVAFSTNEDWTKNAAVEIAASTYSPAQFNGKAVPVLMPMRKWAEHGVIFH